MIAMRLLCLLVAITGGTVWGDALVSISATAGAQGCSRAGASSASCSVSSSVYVPAGQFYSPVSAGGNIFFAPTDLTAISLGPQAAGPLDYTLQGNWSMGQGIGLSGQAGVTLTASIDLPADSGDWAFYGDSYDATDDQGGGVGAIEIVTTDGSGWIEGAPSWFTISHTPGTPFSVSIDVSDFVQSADSSDDFDFQVRMVDPVATPEPATWPLVGIALLLFGFLFRKTLNHRAQRAHKHPVRSLNRAQRTTQA